MARLILAAAFVLVFGVGYVVGQSDQPNAARASIWADYCSFSTSTRYISGAGTVTVLTAVVADWRDWSNDWTTVSARNAAQAVGSFDCEQRY